MSNSMVPIRISPELHTALKVVAAVTGVTMRGFVERVLLQGVREKASQDPELAQAIELILQGGMDPPPAEEQ